MSAYMLMHLVWGGAVSHYFVSFVFNMVFVPIEMLCIEKINPLLWNLLMIVFSLPNQTLVAELLTILNIEALLIVSSLAEIWFSKMSELLTLSSEKMSAFWLSSEHKVLRSWKSLMLFNIKSSCKVSGLGASRVLVSRHSVLGNFDKRFCQTTLKKEGDLTLDWSKHFESFFQFSF